MGNFIFVILDGVGIGELPDAANYGDLGTNTLANISEKIGGISLPNLQKSGIGNISPILGVAPANAPLASYGKMKEVSLGKDSTSGHWELAGIKVDLDFSYFPNGFPDDLMKKFLNLTGCSGYLGNKAASGTEIIIELGEEHLKTGFPIVYTSADSVFQIAAHEEHFGLQRLYDICKIAREQLFAEQYIIGRVIARPFIGQAGNFSRTTNRHDYSLFPPSDTILDLLQKNGIETVAIGKINDLFNNRGITTAYHTKSNAEGCRQILESIKEKKNSFIFANLVDFDVYYGHRNDTEGFAKALKHFDDYLPELISALNDDDVLLLSADHGNDPTDVSTDHTREYVPVLFFEKNKIGENLGTRSTFADAGKTVADFFGIENNLEGKSFFKNK